MYDSPIKFNFIDNDELGKKNQTKQVKMSKRMFTAANIVL